MTVYPILWTQPRENGTCSVKIYVYTDKARYIGTDIAILPDQWNKKNRRVKPNHPLATTYNSILTAKCVEVERRLREGESIRDVQGRSKKQSLIELINQYIVEVQGGLHPIRKTTIKSYVALKNRLLQYCQYSGVHDLHFEDIDMKFYRNYWNFLNTVCKTELQGFANHVKNLKKFMKLGLDRKLHTNLAFRDKEFRMHKKSKGIKFYLTHEEIQKIETLDLSEWPSLQLEKDRFLISYYLLIRFGDSMKINRDNVVESKGKLFYSYTSEKTEVEVVLPLKPAALEIMKRYDYQLPKVSNVKANVKIKQIASLAGINTIIKQGNKSGPKCGFVSTHTARRSGATNLYLDGVSLKMIAQLGGWTRIETLKHYLLASGMDVALVASDYEFFN